jgi:dolichyl-phosphooligosaccharide-protein glycotransferase
MENKLIRGAGIAFVLFAIIAFSLWLRYIPAYFPQFKTTARLIVETDIRQKADEHVKDNYPLYSPYMQQKLSEEIVNKQFSGKSALSQKINDEYENLKAPYQNEQKRTYLKEVDPYCRIRHVRLVLDNGFPGTRQENGKVFDDFMVAPYGEEVSMHSFFYYFSAFTYNMTRFFMPALSLEDFAFYFPLFQTAIFLLILFLFCRRFFSCFTGLFAVFFTGCSHIFIFRSSVGWFDTDILNLTFPLLIIWCIASAVASKTIIKVFSLSLLASFFQALFAFSWVGWWFTLFIAVVFYLYNALNILLIYHNSGKDNKLIGIFRSYVISAGTFLAGTFFFCLFVAGIEPFSIFISSARVNLGLGSAITPSIWPLVEYTVSELIPARGAEIFSHLGFTFITGMFAIIIMAWAYWRSRNSHQGNIVVLLLFWTFFMLFAAEKGARFTLFLSIPFGVFLGIGLEWILSGARHGILSFRKKMPQILLCLVFVVWIIIYFIIQTGAGGIKFSKNIYPYMNDDYNTLFKSLRENTPDEAVINAWWDYGNFIKEIAYRRSIVDPQIQNRPVTYWMARAFISNDENQAIKIFRMMNTSSDRLFDEINVYIKDEYKAISLLNRLIDADNKSFNDVLSQSQLPDFVQDKVREALLSGRPDSAYVLVDRNMMNMIPGISFLGNWDFSRVYAAKNKAQDEKGLTANLKALFDLNEFSASQIYAEIQLASGQSEINELMSRRWWFNLDFSKGIMRQSAVYFENGIIFYPKQAKAYRFDDSQQQWRPYSFVGLLDAGQYHYLSMENENTGKKTADAAEIAENVFSQGCLIRKNNNEWHAIEVSDKGLAESLYSRLFFAKGQGLSCFDLVFEDENQQAYVYEIKW